MILFILLYHNGGKNRLIIFPLPLLVQRRMKHLTSKIIDWNRSQFGNIFQSKNCAYAEPQGFRIALASRPNSYHFHLEKQLNLEYNSIIHQEFLFWQLKSHITWLNQGDANTKYFHITTMQKSSQNRILTLKDPNGIWLTNNSLQDYIIQFFTQLFTTTCHRSPENISSAFFQYHNNSLICDQEVLNCIPNGDEIFENLMNPPPLKAPGLDGFHAIFFFQQNWNLLDDSIITVIPEIFENRIILKE